MHCWKRFLLTEHRASPECHSLLEAVARIYYNDIDIESVNKNYDTIFKLWLIDNTFIFEAKRNSAMNCNCTQTVTSFVVQNLASFCYLSTHAKSCYIMCHSFWRRIDAPLLYVYCCFYAAAMMSNPMPLITFFLCYCQSGIIYTITRKHI